MENIYIDISVGRSSEIKRKNKTLFTTTSSEVGNPSTRETNKKKEKTDEAQTESL